MVSASNFLERCSQKSFQLIPLPFQGFKLFNGKKPGSSNVKTLFNRNDNVNHNHNINAQGPNGNNCFLDCDNNQVFCFQGLGTTLVDVESGVGLA